MRVGGSVVQFGPQQLEHAGRRLGVHMNLLVTLSQLSLVISSDQLEKVQVPAERKSKAMFI